jgi:hypothetical protein
MTIPQKTIERLDNQEERINVWLGSWHSLLQDHPGLFSKLEELEIEPRFNAHDGQVELSFTGDVTRLRLVWKALRAAGFKTEDHPKPKDAQFMAYWRTEGELESVFWMYFTSTSCRTVQIGTKMVEQPVYETQCGEEISVPDEPSALAELGV